MMGLLHSRGGLLSMFGASGAAWENVEVPSGFNTTPPFTIQRGGAGGLFRIDTTFSLQTRAGITVTKTYYVDSVAGNDANSGLTAELALKTLTAAQNKGDADRVYIAPGSYFYKNQRPTQFTRSIEIIGLGSGATISSDISNQLTSWVADGNHYKREPMPDFVAEVVDTTNLDAFGHPIPLTAVASAAAVNNTPNSVYVNYPTGIYVRTHDSRPPDANLRFWDSLMTNTTQDNKTYYYENIAFERSMQFRNNSASGGLKTYFNNCRFRAAVIAGVSECIFQNCVSYGAVGDGFNYDARNGIVTTAYEIDCEAYNLGTDSSSQGSTTHNGCIAIRVNGKYHHTYGQCIADTGTGQSWLLGTEMYNSSPAGIGYYAGVDTWLDHANIHDCANYGIQIISGKTVRHKSITNTSGLDNLGTYVAY